MGGTPPRLAEVFRPELILSRNDCGTQGPVLVRPLRPGETRLPVDPQREPHAFS